MIHPPIRLPCENLAAEPRPLPHLLAEPFAVARHLKLVDLFCQYAREAALWTKPAFLYNATLNRDRQITGVFAGDLEGAYRAGTGFVTKAAMVPVGAPFDIVITSNSGYPLDLNLYQAIKGVSAAGQIVKPGGAIVVAAECSSGVADHAQYTQLLQSAPSSQPASSSSGALPTSPTPLPYPGALAFLPWTAYPLQNDEQNRAAVQPNSFQLTRWSLIRGAGESSTSGKSSAR